MGSREITEFQLCFNYFEAIPAMMVHVSLTLKSMK